MAESTSYNDKRWVKSDFHDWLNKKIRVDKTFLLEFIFSKPELNF